MSDYISREAAKDVVLENIINRVVDEQGMYGYLCNLVGEVFDSIPAADVRPVKPGEWIGEADGYADGELVYDTWYCSCCDYVVEDDEMPSWRFCPNCGAEMSQEAT